MEASPWDAAFTQEEPEEEMSWENVEPEEETPQDSELSLDVLGLLQLGKLTTKADIYGHEVVIRTLTVGEELEIGLLTEQFKNTSEDGRAYATAVVAASLISINRKPLPIKPLGPEDEVNALSYKFDYIKTRYYWPVIKRIYDEYMKLLERQVTALEELKKK
jgi:hypothetical protein